MDLPAYPVKTPELPMQVFSLEPKEIERFSFLDIKDGQPLWQQVLVGENRDLDLLTPYFRLPESDMAGPYVPGWTTWDLRYEDDDCIPNWRPVYVTPIVVWCTNKNGIVRNDFLHKAQVRLLVLSDNMKDTFERIFDTFPVDQHDVQVRGYRNHSQNMDVCPMRANVWGKIQNPGTTRQTEADSIAYLVRLELTHYYRLLKTNTLGDSVAPLLSTDRLNARIAVEKAARERSDLLWEKKNRLPSKIRERDNDTLDQVFADLLSD